jgi:type IV secretion system protein VirB3
VSRLVSDPIFAALTQPQMIGGVTYSYAVFNLIVTLEAFLVTKSFWALAIAPVIHASGYLGCLKDPRFFDLWITRASRCPRVANFGFWRVNTYRP